MTSDTGITKEEDDEEDDTMQNTVVLFSNTDKFVLLQVQLLLCQEPQLSLSNATQIDFLVPLFYFSFSPSRLF